MAFVFTGTATNHVDLLDKIRTHLTNAVVMGTQAWTELGIVEVSASERYCYLRGPGLSATDEIYINIRQYENSAADYYNFQIFGAVGFSAAQTILNQPGASPGSCVPLWNTAIPYTLVADGRHFKLIAKVSTTYQTAYAGFILPYATSLEMPYPMFVGGSQKDPNSRWSTPNYTAGAFFDPPQTCSYMRDFNGSWLEIANYENYSANSRQEKNASVMWPWQYSISVGNNQDLSFGMLPAIIHSNTSGGNVYGELSGVKYVSGFNNAAEDTITDGVDTYLVVQSGYRTTIRDYAAILLG